MQRSSPTGATAALAAFGAATLGVALAARAATGDPDRSAWYRSLDKPPFQPPSWVFGPVWGVLYTLAAISGWRVWRAARSPARSGALVLWAAQLGFNGLWSWLFFRRRAPRTALVDLGLLAATLLGYTCIARRADRPAAAAALPYLAWVGFAGAINAEIVRRNPVPTRPGVRR